MLQPTKFRQIQNHHIDSTRWNDFAYRDVDVVIATYAKAGTTWVQQIVAQLIFEGSEEAEVGMLSPWLDLRVMPKEEIFAFLEAQQHRRFIKTHLPYDALRSSPSAKYIYVARDPRDVIWSMHPFHSTFTPQFYALLNETPGLVGPPLEAPDPDIRRYYRTFLERDGHPFWAFWSHFQSWWNVRKRPNVLLVHFSSLKAGMEGEIRRIAKFLDIAVPEHAWSRIVEHSSFDWMKRNARKLAHPLVDGLLGNGAGSFVNKGSNGRWRDILSAEEVALADQHMEANLTPDCAHWLRTGEFPD